MFPVGLIRGKLKAKLLQKWKINGQLEIDRVINLLASQGMQKALTFVDIGANKGQNLERANRYAKQGYDIVYHGFEMIPETYKYLQYAREKSLCKKCFVYPFGLSDANFRTSICLAPDSQWNSLNNPAWHGDLVEVDLQTFDSIFAKLPRFGPIAVKIDVEGHELSVLKGMECSLRDGEIDIISVEVGFNPEDKQHTYMPKIYDILFAYGFRLCRVDDISPYRHSDWSNRLSIGYCNLMFVSGSF